VNVIETGTSADPGLGTSPGKKTGTRRRGPDLVKEKGVVPRRRWLKGKGAVAPTPRNHDEEGHPFTGILLLPDLSTLRQCNTKQCKVSNVAKFVHLNLSDMCFFSLPL